MTPQYTLVAKSDGESVKTKSGRDLSGWSMDGFGEEVTGTIAEITEVAAQLRGLGCGSYAATEFGAFDGEAVHEMDID